MKKRILMTIAVMMLCCCCAVGTTFAWLSVKTEPVTNTFTVGNIGLTLTESDLDLKMVPGKTLTKDPKVTVAQGSEACWVFVKIEETNNTFTKNATDVKFLTYSVDVIDGDAGVWTALEGTPGVYFKQVDAETAKQGISYFVLKGNAVLVNSEVTASALALANTKAPTLTFTAYAVQQEGFEDVARAWTEASANAELVPQS